MAGQPAVLSATLADKMAASAAAVFSRIPDRVAADAHFEREISE